MAGVALVDMWTRIKDHVIASVPNATLAPQIFDAKANPSPNMDAGYSFALASSTNTGNYRDQDSVRIAHRFTIAFAQRLKMSDQFTSTRDALAREDAVIYCFGKDHRFQGMRANYLGTRRGLTPTREHLIVQIDFALVHDLDRSV